VTRPPVSSVTRSRNRLLDDGWLSTVFSIVSRRAGPFPARIRDVGVAVDLATHDVDILSWIAGERPVRVYAEIARRVATDHEDYAGWIHGVLAAEERLENRCAPLPFRREPPQRTPTAYELEWRAEGRPAHYFSYARRLSSFGGELGSTGLSRHSSRPPTAPGTGSSVASSVRVLSR